MQIQIRSLLYLSFGYTYLCLLYTDCEMRKLLFRCQDEDFEIHHNHQDLDFGLKRSILCGNSFISKFENNLFYPYFVIVMVENL
jgi:hypothetical protein